MALAAHGDACCTAKSVSKYCYFVSLTYKNEFIPYYEVETHEIDEDNIAVHAFVYPRRRLTRTITFHDVVLRGRSVAGF